MSFLNNQNRLMNYCPCCTDKLLRHLNRNSIYWFCPQCRQTMAIVHSQQGRTAVRP